MYYLAALNPTLTGDWVNMSHLEISILGSDPVSNDPQRISVNSLPQCTSSRKRTFWEKTEYTVQARHSTAESLFPSHWGLDLNMGAGFGNEQGIATY